MQGKSSHNKQGDRSANRTGVASWLCATIAPGGQALTQSPHVVQRSRKSASPTAPGGRSQSVRVGAGPFAGAASASRENSCAAFATERTESLMKSRRPYEGSLTMERDTISPARWSKWPSISSAQPRRAKMRRSANSAAALLLPVYSLHTSRDTFHAFQSDVRTKLAAIFTTWPT